MQRASISNRSTAANERSNVLKRTLKRSRQEDPKVLKASKVKRSNCSAPVYLLESTEALPPTSCAPAEPPQRAKQRPLFAGRQPNMTTRVTDKITVLRIPKQSKSHANFFSMKRGTREIVAYNENSLVETHIAAPKTATVEINRSNGSIPRKHENIADCCSKPVQDAPAKATTTDPGDSTLQLTEVKINSRNLLPDEYQALQVCHTFNAIKSDTAAYGHNWFIHHKQREKDFEPWQQTLNGKLELLRLEIIQQFWEAVRMCSVSHATVHVAANNLSRLLHCRKISDLDPLASAARLATNGVVAFRLAFKTEERPEVLWEVPNIWNLFPIFSNAEMDKSEATLNRIELECIRLLGDSMDVPMGPMFLDLYLKAGGWPASVAAEYHELALYLISLATFASTRDTGLRNVSPSKMAAAALVLSVKIVNSDRAAPSGILQHLPNCACAERPELIHSKVACICRFEFFPERLRMYCAYSFEELQPAIRGLSCLLRSKPAQASVLKHFFPIWGDNDWQ